MSGRTGPLTDTKGTNLFNRNSNTGKTKTPIAGFTSARLLGMLALVPGEVDLMVNPPSTPIPGGVWFAAYACGGLLTFGWTNLDE